MIQGAAIYAETADICRFAAEQAEALKTEPSARRWLVIALVVALQGACLCALLANGDNEDTQEPGKGAKLAAPGVLLRRAASPEYLAEPARLPFSASELKTLETLIAERNAAIHFLGGAEASLRAFNLAAKALDHLLLSAPAFDLGLLGLRPARLRGSLMRLRTALKYLPAD